LESARSELSANTSAAEVEAERSWLGHFSCLNLQHFIGKINITKRLPHRVVLKVKNEIGS
jgi:hypothetical protein